MGSEHLHSSLLLAQMCRCFASQLDVLTADPHDADAGAEPDAGAAARQVWV